MDRRDPEAIFLVVVAVALPLAFIIAWGYFVRWIVEVFG